MKKPSAIGAIERLLSRENGYSQELLETPAAKKLQSVCSKMLEHVHEIGRGSDIALIVAAERAIVHEDRRHYANSKQMASSLDNAMTEIGAIERHLGIVGNKPKYQVVDQAHSLAKNRKKGLPYDEARQALRSHHARLNNLDKARLSDDEKKLIDARKSAIFSAEKLYTEKQAKTLGVDLV